MEVSPSTFSTVKIALIGRNEIVTPMIDFDDWYMLGNSFEIARYTYKNFTKDAEYNNFLSELEQLKKIQIRNNFPDISQSLKMLRNIVKLRLESDKALQPDVESKPLTPVETQKAQ